MSPCSTTCIRCGTVGTGACIGGADAATPHPVSPMVMPSSKRIGFKYGTQLDRKESRRTPSSSGAVGKKRKWPQRVRSLPCCPVLRRNNARPTVACSAFVRRAVAGCQDEAG